MAALYRGRRHLLRLRGQECPVSVVRLVARRNGRADAGLRARPLRHDGRRWRLPRGSILSGAYPGRAARDRHRRWHHAVHRRNDRLGRQRHQARAGVFNREPTGLHDAGPGGWWLVGGTVSPGHTCVLQKPAVPLLGLRDSRLPYQRHAEDGRPRPRDAMDRGDDARRLSGHHRRRHSLRDRSLRLLLQGRHPRPGSVVFAGESVVVDPLLCGGRRCLPDRVLHVSALVHDVCRYAEGSSRRRACP